MQYRTAKLDDLGSVFSIAQANIRDVYPYFYPAAAVQWYADQHSCERILADITAGRVRLLEERGVAVGTATIDGNRLLRVFVAPEQQRKGYGTRLMQLLEGEVGRGSEAVVLDSSLPAGRFFQGRGYRTRSHELYDVVDKHGMLLTTLAWEVMEKPLHPEAAKASGEDAAKAAEPPAPAVEAEEPTKLAAASEPVSAVPAESPAASAATIEGSVEAAAAAPAPMPAPAPAQEGATTITISSGTADVMKGLPQMPF